MPVEKRRISKYLEFPTKNLQIGFTTTQIMTNSFLSIGKNQIQIQGGCTAHIQRATIEDNICVLTKKMVRPSMSKFFKKRTIKINPEISPGVCPHCQEMSDFISIVNDYYRCITCGADVKQYINGVIKYIPLGKEKIEEEHGS